MKNFTIEKGFLSKGFLVISSLFTISLYAQDAKQVKAIQQKTNLKALESLKKSVLATKPSQEKLRAKAKKMNLPFYKEDNGTSYQLMNFDEGGLPMYYRTYNAGAASGTQTDKLNSTYGVFGLDGQGMRIYEWDGGGVRLTHQEFGGRVIQGDTPLQQSDHATHVAGTMVASGVDSDAKGMAPLANLTTYDWTNDETEMATAAANGALVSNHSYGYMSGFEWDNASGNRGWHWQGSDAETEYIRFGQYSSHDGDWDRIALNAPYYLPVKAAGNPRGAGPEPGGQHWVRIEENESLVWVESHKVRQKNGGEDGFDTVNNGSTGKNILVVAAAEKINGGYTQPSDVKVASFSAFGPTDDGRIKPDITGIGVNVFSTVTSGDNAYETISGTSMASPNVTGSLALLQQHYGNLNNNQFMLSTTLKALAIHTANEAGDADGPDYKHGWGLLNAFKAAETITVKNQYALIEEKTLNNSSTETLELVASGTEPLVATIVWNDPVPETFSDSTLLDDPTVMLVNDLDSKIVEGSDTFLPWVLDPANPSAAATTGDNIKDNVEQIVIKNPTAGKTYTLTVSHKGTLKTNDSEGKLIDTNSQNFSLIVTGIRKDVDKDLAMLDVKVNAEPKDYSTQTPVQISFYNKGSETINGAKVKYSLLNKDSGVENDLGSIDVNNLASGEKKTETVRVNLSKPFINYDIVAIVEYTEDQVTINNKTSASAYGIVADLTEEGSSHKFGFEADFEKNGWTSQDIDNDGRTWRKYDDAEIAKTGNSFAINFSNDATGVNDWLFSNPLKLRANQEYRIIFDAGKARSADEPLQIFFGQTPDSGAMTTSVSPAIKTERAWTKYTYTFTPTAEGLHYIGFQSKTETDVKSYAVFVDDVVVMYAKTKPIADFSASKKDPNTFETVTLKDETVTHTELPITKREWTFEPSTVTYLEGTNASAQNLKVKFDAEGTYTVTLKVTNSKGDDTATKTSFITVKDTETKAGFTANKSSVFESDVISFTNISSGNPEPTEWKWEVTPNTGYELHNNTTLTSKNLELKFNTKGKYDVSLTATSLKNSATATLKDIEVKTPYEVVRNLSHTFNADTKDLDLVWERPALLDSYSENFEHDGNLPEGYTFHDANNDGKGWMLTNSAVRSGKYAMQSASFADRVGIDADNWMVTEKLRKGSEILKFWIVTPYPEKFGVYIVSAPASGNSPTLEEVKNGELVYDKLERGEQSFFSHKLVEIDLAGKTETDFFVAIHHDTKKEDDYWFMVIDDISLGYKNDIEKTDRPSETNTETVNVNAMKYGEVLMEKDAIQPVAFTKNGEIKTFGETPYPQLTGYEVHKDGSVISTINDTKTKTVRDNIAGQSGSHTYDVYALYSDSKKSDKETLTIRFEELSTDELSIQTMKVYPNPTKGQIFIKANSDVKSLSVQVFDMAGRMVESKKSNSNDLELNLSNQTKGIYILSITDDSGKKKTAKVIVK